MISLDTLDAVRMNDATVYQILRNGGTLEQCVVTLANQKCELVKKVCDLELIAPKKIRLSDGSVRIYRAPEHLLPDPPYNHE
jgi:hypothetical protein